MIKLFKKFVILAFKKIFELIGSFCEICSACMWRDFGALDDNQKDDNKIEP